MPRDPELAEVLSRFVERSGYSMGQLGRLSEVPKRTIANWLGGRVRRPRHAEDLLKLAHALHLDGQETDELLLAARHPSLRELRATAEDETVRDLLAQIGARELEGAPFQAIPDLPYFVGREKEVRALREALLDGGRALICSLQGMGGVGKTALAAHLAYRLRPEFPDGVLWASVDKAEPMSILSAFAGAYGRDVTSYTDVESRSQVVREILANKQALIILDSVQGSEEVKPLLPPSAGRCAVLITTRRQNLAVTSGTYRFTVGPFDKTEGEAMTLFTEILGEERVARETAALAKIADLLGHLPLAVAIAASRLAYEPGWSAAEFLERLEQEQERLDLLRYDDRSVRLSTRVSYDMLRPGEQAFFAALGALSPENVNVEAMAAVTEQPPEAVQETLRRLYALSLVQVGHGERYRLHPLLHDLARERLRLSEKREAVLGRMIEYYAAYVIRHRHNYDALQRELDNIVASVKVARDQAMAAEIVRTVTGLQDFLETKGLYDLASEQLELAREAARSLGNEAGLARVLLYQTRLSRKRGTFTEAMATGEEGLALAREEEDYHLISACLGELGATLSSRGQVLEAYTHFREGLILARELGDPDLTSTHLLYLGIDNQRSNPEQARAYYAEGLALAREIGDATKKAKFLNNLGSIASEMGEFTKAKAYYRESLALGQELGYQELTGIARVNLGEIARLHEEYGQARDHLEEALAVARNLGQRRLLRLALDQLGELALAQGQYEEAEEFYREALSAIRGGEDRLAVGYLLLRLAQVLSQRGGDGEVEACFDESFRLARRGTNYHAQASLLNEWGELLLQMGHIEAASSAYAEALVLAQEGDADRALEAAKKGLQSTG